MHAIVRKTLEIYLHEQRIPTISDFSSETAIYSITKESIFVTLYYQGKVIASSGRIACKKENTLYECIDNSLLCLKDPRFLAEIQNREKLSEIRIRTDRFAPNSRRVLQSIDTLDTTKEWLIFLSQNLGVLSVILPHMVHMDSSPKNFFSLACKKLGLDESRLTSRDYVIYALTTIAESDF